MSRLTVFIFPIRLEPDLPLFRSSRSSPRALHSATTQRTFFNGITFGTLRRNLEQPGRVTTEHGCSVGIAQPWRSKDVLYRGKAGEPGITGGKRP